MVPPVVNTEAALWVAVDPPGFDQRCDQASWLAARPAHSRLDAVIGESADVAARRVFSGEMPEQLQAAYHRCEIAIQKLAEMLCFRMPWSAAFHRCLSPTQTSRI
jgi:hypothetical protein